ncbi:MAG: hypothetical protein JWN44_2009 [Myxococcales bacterium]|nr:hypothetical protein [Myxococcales bacterium]
MRLLATLAVLVAGCTAHNPSFVGDGGATDDLAGGGGSSDLATGPLDLSGPMGSCSAGQRMCAGTQASDRCEGGIYVVDRNCPAGSECMSTYCAPPLPGVGTQVGQRCDASGGPQQLQCSAALVQNLSCQPFIDPVSKDYRWYCDSPAGGGSAGTPCTRGSDCRSGFCGSNGTCFEACQAAGPGSGCALRCQSVQIVVEGVKQTVKSCSP